ncbi:hypothetical protein F4561_005896 [Lipingzhangella halophila]|uniref:Uncharacterized protein n=1 Tax=Lipingzhangella halophila TaxID=1783352 RepID=A0A7W7RNJ5_9ACTN|nr:hypothetical protein [Lipingzhangella halophila]
MRFALESALLTARFVASQETSDHSTYGSGSGALALRTARDAAKRTPRPCSGDTRGTNPPRAEARFPSAPAQGRL